MRLKDKAIIVTGSTAGIGKATAQRCIDEGAQVLIHGLEKDLCESVADELGENAVSCCEDLADPGAPNRIVDAAITAFGKLDAVVNNAAWVNRSTLDETDAALFDKVMAINLRAPMLMIKAARPHLKESHGAVLNIGSVNTWGGEPILLSYSVSKAGLQTLSRNLADALRDDRIRIYHFNPGWVLTENEYQRKLEDGLPKDWPEQLPSYLVPTGHMLRPEDIAAALVFWMTDEAAAFSGTTMELEQYPWLGRNPSKAGGGEFAGELKPT